MASYTPNVAAHKTLTGATVDTITFAQPINGFVLTNRTGTNEIYFTAGGAPADPVVGANDTNVVPAAAGAAKKVTLPEGESSFVVKLISSGAMAYSIEAF